MKDELRLNRKERPLHVFVLFVYDECVSFWKLLLQAAKTLHTRLSTILACPTTIRRPMEIKAGSAQVMEGGGCVWPGSEGPTSSSTFTH